MASLGSFLFARRYWGNRFFFLFLKVLRCFSSLRSSHYPIYSDNNVAVLTKRDTKCLLRQVSQFGILRIKACLAAHRSISQPSTSFISFWYQDIHHVPLIAWSPNFLIILHRLNCVYCQRTVTTHLKLYKKLVEMSGIEPLTSALQGPRSPSWATPPS